MTRASRSALYLLALSGCGGPRRDVTPTEPLGGPAPGENAPTPLNPAPETAAVESAPPPARRPGNESATPPGGNGDPGSVRFNLQSGEGILLSGSATYGSLTSGAVKGGKLHLDILQMKPDSKFPVLVHGAVLDQWGPWSVEAPKGLGEVGVVLFLDRNNNGPEPGEPTWSTALTVQDAPIAGITAALDEHFQKPPPVGPDKPPSPGGSGREGGIEPPSEP